MKDGKITIDDPWIHLRRYTGARIALGRSGTSLTTSELLRFRLDHARARDAVWKELNTGPAANSLQKYKIPVVELTTLAVDRAGYISRPDLGKELNPDSKEILKKIKGGFDLSIVIADGLSAPAIERNLVPFMNCLMPVIREKGYSVSPFCVVSQGRVAISDEIGYLLKSGMCIILIGERPGLSSPDSMGIYLTYKPVPGNTDEKRNCISNIRPGGLDYRAASDKLMYLVGESFRLKLSGVNLKDDQETNGGLLKQY